MPFHRRVRREAHWNLRSLIRAGAGEKKNTLHRTRLKICTDIAGGRGKKDGTLGQDSGSGATNTKAEPVSDSGSPRVAGHSLRSSSRSRSPEPRPPTHRLLLLQAHLAPSPESRERRRRRPRLSGIISSLRGGLRPRPRWSSW